MLQSSIASGPLQGTSNIRACTAVRATAWHTLPAPLLRRRIFLSSLMTVSPLVTLHTGVALAEEAPACATCLGNVDGTLGSCAGLEVCASSFDDRPPFFVAPWAFEGSQDVAVAALERALADLGAVVRTRRSDYLYATLPLGANGADSRGNNSASDSSSSSGSLLDLEFVFAGESDNTVALRAAQRRQPTSGSGAGAPLVRALAAAMRGLGGASPTQVLEQLRLRLGWEEVPVLRNRRSRLLFGESPLDDFGPVPPPVPDYERDLLLEP